MTDDYEEDGLIVTIGMCPFDCDRCGGLNTVRWNIGSYECGCGMSYSHVHDFHPYGEQGFVTLNPKWAELDEKYDIEWNQVDAHPSCTFFMGPSGVKSNGTTLEEEE